MSFRLQNIKNYFLLYFQKEFFEKWWHYRDPCENWKLITTPGYILLLITLSDSDYEFELSKKFLFWIQKCADIFIAEVGTTNSQLIVLELNSLLRPFMYTH